MSSPYELFDDICKESMLSLFGLFITSIEKAKKVPFSLLKQEQIVAAIPYHGTFSGTVLLVLQEKDIAAVVDIFKKRYNFCGQLPDSTILAEFLNVCSAHACTALSRHDIAIEICPPLANPQLAKPAIDERGFMLKLTVEPGLALTFYYFATK